MMNKLIGLPILLIFLIVFSVSNVSAQRDNNETSVKLEKDARKNGYKSWEKNGFFYFQTIKVIDPTTGKPLKGLHDLSYLCGAENSLNRIRLEFSKGNTQRIVVACAVLNEPKIILMDEPLPN